MIHLSVSPSLCFSIALPFELNERFKKKKIALPGLVSKCPQYPGLGQEPRTQSVFSTQGAGTRLLDSLPATSYEVH